MKLLTKSTLKPKLHFAVTPCHGFGNGRSDKSISICATGNAAKLPARQQKNANRPSDMKKVQGVI